MNKELLNFVQNSMLQHFDTVDHNLANVICDCLEEAVKEREKPMVSVTLEVGALKTTFAATSVKKLMELRREWDRYDDAEDRRIQLEQEILTAQMGDRPGGKIV